MKPMLAFKTKPSKLSYPCIIQPKFNGVRGLYLPEHSTLQSRDGILWEPSVVERQLTQLTSLKFPLDGELYAHGLSLQQINSRIAVKRIAPHDEAWKVSYYIFDIPCMKPMWQRAKMLARLAEVLDGKPNVVVADTHTVSSQSEADYYYKLWKDQGFEGLMYRQTDAPYGFAHNCGNQENRWWYLQKRKEFLDMEATIEDVYEGEESFRGILGGFHCRMDNGVPFDVGGGLTLEDRQRYWSDPARVIGARIRVNYEMLSDGGNPLKATIESVDELY